jgi:hypothetical protein
MEKRLVRRSSGGEGREGEGGHVLGIYVVGEREESIGDLSINEWLK